MSKPLSFLRETIFSSTGHEIARHGSESVKSLAQIACWFSQDNLVATTQDLDLVHIEAEFFRQTDGLAVAGLEDAGFAHRAISATFEVYTRRIYDTSECVEYPEGTVIQEGNGPEQMCARVLIPGDPGNPPTYRPQWITTSDAARQRSATVIHLPEPPPVYCSAAPPNGSGLCTCEGLEGAFSRGALVNSAKGPHQLRCDHGKWAQTSIPNRKK